MIKNNLLKEQFGNYSIFRVQMLLLLVFNKRYKAYLQTLAFICQSAKTTPGSSECGQSLPVSLKKAQHN